jgi:DNA polymerase-3 subunit gamma/tau
MPKPKDRVEPAGDYQVVARRFRPKTFDEIVGQDAILQSLQASLASGKLHHAFLFAGSRGTGKTTLARILARALNCERGPTPQPCGTCAACTSILAGTNPDVVEIDAASHNLVDDVRELRDHVAFASLGSRFKVYILDEAHMLTRNAFNAFLKTLEEPPRNVKFVLATTELHKVPDTIRSRCEVHLFSRLEPEAMVARLRKLCAEVGARIDDAVLAEVARAARGGMRDAETALERLLSFAGPGQPALDLARYQEVTHRVGLDQAVDVLRALAAGDAAPALRFAQLVVSAGLDEREVLGELVDLLRALLLVHVDGPATPLIAHGEAMRARLQEVAAAAGRHRIEAMIQAALLGRERLRKLEDRQLVLEFTLVRMAEAGTLPQLGELYAALERGGAAGAGAPPPAPARAPAAASAARPQSPAPAPARGAGVAAPAGSDLKTALLARLRGDQSLVAGTIELCELTGPDPQGVVRVKLTTPQKLHRDRLASDAIQQDLRARLRGLCERDVELRVETPAAAAGADAPAAPGKRPEPGPAVRKVIERFDGDLLEPEDG